MSDSLRSSNHGIFQARVLEWVSFSAEHQRIDSFKLWCWRRLLRVPWTARRLNQSILREINPEYSLEGLMLKLKLQYFGHRMRRTDSLEKTLMLGKIEDRRRREQQRMRWLDSITDSVQLSRSVVSRSCDPMNCSTPGSSVLYYLPEFAQMHVH